MASTPGSSDEKHRLVQILTWFLYLVGVFCVLARLGTKFVLNRKLGWDDRILLTGQVRI
jgi:hypothetical protein